MPDPDNRITLTEAMKHPWIDECNLCFQTCIAFKMLMPFCL